MDRECKNDLSFTFRYSHEQIHCRAVSILQKNIIEQGECSILFSNRVAGDTSVVVNLKIKKKSVFSKINTSRGIRSPPDAKELSTPLKNNLSRAVSNVVLLGNHKNNRTLGDVVDDKTKKQTVYLSSPTLI